MCFIDYFVNDEAACRRTYQTQFSNQILRAAGLNAHAAHKARRALQKGGRHATQHEEDLPAFLEKSRPDQATRRLELASL